MLSLLFSSLLCSLALLSRGNVLDEPDARIVNVLTMMSDYTLGKSESVFDKQILRGDLEVCQASISRQCMDLEGFKKGMQKFRNENWTLRFENIKPIAMAAVYSEHGASLISVTEIIEGHSCDFRLDRYMLIDLDSNGVVYRMNILETDEIGAMSAFRLISQGGSCEL